MNQWESSSGSTEENSDSDYEEDSDSESQIQDLTYTVRVYGRKLNGDTYRLNYWDLSILLFTGKDSITAGDVGKLKYELIELLPKRLQKSWIM